METTTLAPPAEEVDRRAIEFNKLDADLKEATDKAKAAAEALKTVKEELIELVREYGSAHAEKSKLLHGIVWEMMATFGQSTTQDAAAVERLRMALVKAKKARLLKKLFTKDERWKLSSGARKVIESEKLTPKQLALVLRCFVTEDVTPRLDVREKKKT